MDPGDAILGIQGTNVAITIEQQFRDFKHRVCRSWRAVLYRLRQLHYP